MNKKHFYNMESILMLKNGGKAYHVKEKEEDYKKEEEIASNKEIRHFFCFVDYLDSARAT